MSPSDSASVAYTLPFDSTVKENSVITVQIFDPRKFKKRDQDLLAVVNEKVSDAIDLELGGHGTFICMPGACPQNYSRRSCVPLAGFSGYCLGGWPNNIFILPRGKGDA